MLLTGKRRHSNGFVLALQMRAGVGGTETSQAHLRATYYSPSEKLSLCWHTACCCSPLLSLHGSCVDADLPLGLA